MVDLLTTKLPSFFYIPFFHLAMENFCPSKKRPLMGRWKPLIVSRHDSIFSTESIYNFNVPAEVPIDPSQPASKKARFVILNSNQTRRLCSGEVLSDRKLILSDGFRGTYLPDESGGQLVFYRAHDDNEDETMIFRRAKGKKEVYGGNESVVSGISLMKRGSLVSDSKISLTDSSIILSEPGASPDHTDEEDEMVTTLQPSISTATRDEQHAITTNLIAITDDDLLGTEVRDSSCTFPVIPQPPLTLLNFPSRCIS